MKRLFYIMLLVMKILLSGLLYFNILNYVTVWSMSAIPVIVVYVIGVCVIEKGFDKVFDKLKTELELI